MPKKKTRPESNGASKRSPSNCIIHVKTSKMFDFVCLSDLEDAQERCQKIYEMWDKCLKEPLSFLEECKMCVNKFRQSLVIMMAIIGAAISSYDEHKLSQSNL